MAGDPLAEVTEIWHGCLDRLGGPSAFHGVGDGEEPVRMRPLNRMEDARSALDGTVAVAGIDVGGTSIKGVLVGDDGSEFGRFSVQTPAHQGTDAIINAIASVVEGLSQLAPGELRAVGLVLAGLIDRDAGVVRFSANIGMYDVPIRSLLAERTCLPVVLEHDVRAAALAEMSAGAARGISDSLVLTLGTGIAGAVISASQIVFGSDGMAGEIGHLPVVPGGDLCACGQRGCAEAYASASALTRRYAFKGGAAGTSPPELFVLWQRGDALAALVLTEAITALARTLISYTVIMDPARIVVGGGMSTAGEALLAPLRREVSSGLAWRRAPDIVPAHFGADAGRRGAAMIAWAAVRRIPAQEPNA